MDSVDELRRRYGAALGSSGQATRLDEGSVVIACAVHQDTQIAIEVARFDDVAASCDGDDAAGLASELFGSGRFRGNVENYYEVQNSLIPAVFDRGLGIPISLSALFIEVARRRGVQVAGVGMPGHFLTRSGDRFYDPFHGGQELDAHGCQQLYERLAGRPMRLPPEALEPTATEQILQRMLWNLRSIAEGRDDASLRFRVLALLDCHSNIPLQVRMSWASALAERGRFDRAAEVATSAAEGLDSEPATRLLRIAEQWSARLN